MSEVTGLTDEAMLEQVLAAVDEQTCVVCDPPKPFSDRQGTRKHLRRVHGIEVPARPPFGRTDTGERAPNLPKPGRPGKAGLESRFAASLATVGLGVRFLCPECGDTWIAGTPDMARAWIGVGNENPRVRQAIELISGGGAWGTAIMTTVMVFLPMAAHHGILPGRAPGDTTAPDGAAGAAEGNGAPHMHPDGSVSFAGQRFPADVVSQAAEAMGVDPSMFGATTVDISG